MAKPVNLNQFRKKKARADKKAKAEENVVRFGQTGDQKRLDRARVEKARRDLDGHKAEE